MPPKFVLIDKVPLRVGSFMTQDAFSGDGICLLREGCMITSEAQLLRLALPDVQFGEYVPPENRRKSVDVEEDPNIEIDGIVANEKVDENGEPIQVEEIDEVALQIERATEVKAAVVENVTSIFERLQTGENVDVGSAQDAVAQLSEEMLTDRYSLTSVVKLKSADEYTFTHCVNVSILAMYLTLYSDWQPYLHDIGVGALLHDIGKVGVPTNVLHKTGLLDFSEMNVIKRHPRQGAQLLFSSGCRNEVILSCVLDHHEKVMGSGYPNGKSGDAVTPFARIVAIADIYDALTTDRPYRKAMKPNDALAIMTNKMYGELDVKLLQLFINVIGEVMIFDAAHSDGSLPGEMQTVDEILPVTLSSFRQIATISSIDAVA